MIGDERVYFAPAEAAGVEDLLERPDEP